MLPLSLAVVKALAEQYSYRRRMPKWAQQLALDASSLSEVDRAKLQTFMFELGLPARMARRACQAAPSCLKGAIRIIDAMESLLGKETTIAVLREAEYDRRLAAHATRIAGPKKNQLLKAVLLLEHIRDVFGATLELDEQIDSIRRRANERTMLQQPAFMAPCH